MTYRFVSIQPCPQDNFFSIITLEKIPGIVESFFGEKPTIERFRGNGTVWYNMQTGWRAGCTGGVFHDLFIGSTIMEGFLFNLWYKNKGHSTIDLVC